MDCCESTPLQPTGTYSLTHSPMFGIPETLPYSETLFFLSFSLFETLSVFLPCPATPNSKLCLSRPSQGLRFLSVLSCFVLSARACDDTFSLFLSIPTPIYHETDRIVGVSSPRPPDQNEKKKKREFTSIAASDQTKRVDVYV